MKEAAVEVGLVDRQSAEQPSLPSLPQGKGPWNDGFCQAVLGNAYGSGTRAHEYGGGKRRTERCRNKASVQARLENQPYPLNLCRVHEPMLPHLEIVPDWWMWPEEVIGHLAKILHRAYPDGEGRIAVDYLLKNIEKRLT